MRILGIRKGLVLGVIAQFLQYGAALLLLPLIVTYLSPEQVGVWYVFIAVQGLAMLMDFGFQPSFARSFALAFSGSQELAREGLAAARGEAANYALAGKVLLAAKVIYAGASLIALALLLSLGTLYIGSVGTLTQGEVTDAWVIFSFAVSVNLYLMWISPLLIGADKVDRNYLYLIVNRGTFFLLGAILLIQGYGLSGLSAAFLLAPLVARVAVSGSLNPLLFDIRRAGEPNFSAARTVLTTIWHNSKKMGVVSLGAYLITRYNIFVVSTFVGLSAAASYGITIQILMAVHLVSQLAFQISLPAMIRARVEHDIGQLRKLFSAASLFYFLIFIFMAASVFFFGNWLFSSVGGGAGLVEDTVLAMLIGIFLLEGNHANSALVITTGNKVPFVVPAILSGIAIVFLSTLAGYLGAGLIAIVLIQGLVQLSYNNWKWPKMIYEELYKRPDLKV